MGLTDSATLVTPIPVDGSRYVVVDVLLLSNKPNRKNPLKEAREREKEDERSGTERLREELLL